jgi:hypothetical protein
MSHHPQPILHVLSKSYTTPDSFRCQESIGMLFYIIQD